MAKPSTPRWPTTPWSIFFGNVASPPTLSKAVKEGRIVRLAPGVYTANTNADPAEVVARNRFEILAHLIPDAILVDRTAANDGEITSGRLFVASASRSADVKLPGLWIGVRRGTPLDGALGDPAWTSGLRISGGPRTLVDNLAPSRTHGGAARTLSISELQDWLATKLIAWGPERFERLRLEAHDVARALGSDRSSEIDPLFAAVRSSGPIRGRATPLVEAVRGGVPWDERRVETFARLSEVFREAEPGVWDEPSHLDAGTAIGELPFWEAYFSNFIEGTEFTVDEAREIVETREVPTNRPADGHDVLGTYLCVADPVGRSVSPEDPDELMTYLRARHRSMLEQRQDIRPGEWKIENNQAGGYIFVEHPLVEGTLRQGFELAMSIPRGFRRALFLMFVISEVHPFADGNGRTARVMANAELSASGQARIVVPIVFRNEYLAGLRRLSTSGDPTAYARTMAYTWRWTALMPWHDRASCDGMMHSTNALIDSTEAANTFRRLELP